MPDDYGAMAQAMSAAAQGKGNIPGSSPQPTLSGRGNIAGGPPGPMPGAAPGMGAGGDPMAQLIELIVQQLGRPPTPQELQSILGSLSGPGGAAPGVPPGLSGMPPGGQPGQPSGAGGQPPMMGAPPPGAPMPRTAMPRL